jgi:hypothetical protein
VMAEIPAATTASKSNAMAAFRPQNGETIMVLGVARGEDVVGDQGSRVILLDRLVTR